MSVCDGKNASRGPLSRGGNSLREWSQAPNGRIWMVTVLRGIPKVAPILQLLGPSGSR
ncbi:hypothetical protein [Pseudozobellia thermophila]|uniref:hypothetical protein n=1 Tax=Pseudozobellia thermophila TaxID=192903 RepID=UPI001BB03BDE|nr:hypothetical protein [Pseudozobellia thermophila]